MSKNPNVDAKIRLIREKLKEAETAKLEDSYVTTNRISYGNAGNGGSGGTGMAVGGGTGRVYKFDTVADRMWSVHPDTDRLEKRLAELEHLVRTLSVRLEMLVEQFEELKQYKEMADAIALLESLVGDLAEDRS